MIEKQTFDIYQPTAQNYDPNWLEAKHQPRKKKKVGENFKGNCTQKPATKSHFPRDWEEEQQQKQQQQHTMMIIYLQDNKEREHRPGRVVAVVVAGREDGTTS